MKAIVSHEGVVRLTYGGEWRAAGIAGRGTTPTGASVRWFQAVALPLAALTPAQEAQHESMSVERTRIYGRPERV